MFYDILLQEQLVWNTRLLIVFICTAAIYIFLLKRFTNMKCYHMQPLIFLFSLGFLYVVIGSPLSGISHLSFSLHMIQMSILYFILPPFLLLGIPEHMHQQIIELSMKRRISPLAFSPKVALYCFAVLFLMYHLPVVLHLLSQHSSLQNGYLFILFLLSFGMWWPIASPNPKHRLTKERLKRYAFLSGLVLMPACMVFMITALVNSGGNPFLTQITAHLCIPQSSSLSLLPKPFNTTFDQLMAGIFMLGLHKVGLIMTCKLGDKILVYH